MCLSPFSVFCHWFQWLLVCFLSCLHWFVEVVIIYYDFVFLDVLYIHENCLITRPIDHAFIKTEWRGFTTDWTVTCRNVGVVIRKSGEMEACVARLILPPAAKIHAHAHNR